MGDGASTAETSVARELVSCESERNQGPYEGMVFDSEEAARIFYEEYATREGFVTRVLSSRKSERDGSIISRGLGCREGPPNGNSDQVAIQKRNRRRDGCTAMILVKREKPGRWVVKKFVRDHNHPLVVSLPKRRRAPDEKDRKIQELTAELRVKKRLSAAYRDQLLSLTKDVEEHNEHLSVKVQVVVRNLKELEAKWQELLQHR
ncbi:protein FAR1-RELATED SEQUENCE 2-like [Diospyros lotus]|uniref:protein FAR1-RELATED SEQUENCE 2-like n=1 Tax=Diospyros lotus TaxID=55363 RepID=UPI0022540C7F|nr:protein FAR1-RELATED SEQUENCE 2-like [Diospyros lotus]XP_052207102.1 protein FAR1-RELATED SEQUENCE 2-like [Diospyros lotus]